jgi:CheY-like chemotaxis protein
MTTATAAAVAKLQWAPDTSRPHWGDETEVEAMDAGADDYIRKPLEPARFVARVKAALRRAGS